MGADRPESNKTMIWDNECRMVDDPEGEARKIILSDRSPCRIRQEMRDLHCNSGGASQLHPTLRAHVRFQNLATSPW